MHLTLLVPELIWPEPADEFTLGKLSAPGIEWLLAHGALTRHPRRPFEVCLADSFGVDEAPLGALRLLGDNHPDARSGHWLCADPVHLRFHHERIILADAGAFDLERTEAQALVASLNEHFADIGEFHVADARRWYLRLHTPTDHPVPPLTAVAGRRVDGDIKGGALPLTRWLNEVQMFLHGHPVNDARQALGKPAINSLWLWGGGQLAAINQPGFSEVWSNTPLATGLARAAQLPQRPVPPTLDACLPDAGPNPLVVLDDLLPRVLYEDGEGWRKTLARLDQDWFIPARQKLGGRIKHLTLIAPTVYGELHATLGGSERWKFWKRLDSLSTLANRFAGHPPQ